MYDAYTWKGKGTLSGPNQASGISSALDGKTYIANEAGASGGYYYLSNTGNLSPITPVNGGSPIAVEVATRTYSPYNN